MHWPLPHPITIRRWLKDVPANPSYQLSARFYLSKFASSSQIPEYARYVVISFDEVSVDNRPCYSQKNKNFYIGCTKALVFLARSLMGNWKQIVFYSYTASLTVDLVQNVIRFTQSAGFRVVAVVCDMAPTNVRTRKSLGIAPEKPFFQNPDIHAEKVWFLHDIPHALKLLRNHFLDEGLVFANGVECCAEIITELLRE